MRDFLKLYWPLVVLVLAGLVFAISKIEPAPPKSVVFAAGSEGGSYYTMALEYAEALQDEGVELTILTTSGSLENLSLLRAGKVDMAWLQGGIAPQEATEEIAALGGMFFEPFWVFVPATSPVTRFSDLHGSKMAIGGEGSGTRALAEVMQAEFGQDWPANSKLSMDGAAAREALKSGQIDAAVFVTASQTAYIQDLLKDNTLRLLPMPEARGLDRRHNSLIATDLFQGVVDPASPMPAQDVPMIAAVAQLYVKTDLHPAIQSLLLSAAQSIHSGGSAVSDIGSFPTPEATDLPLSKQATNFYQRGPTFLRRIFPFAVANFMERAWILAIPILTLLIPLVRAAPPIYRWRTRRKIYVWYGDLRDLEFRGRAALTRADKHLVKKHLRQLQSEIGNVEVPLSYTDDLYRLRSHVAFVHSLVDDPTGQSFGHAPDGELSDEGQIDVNLTENDPTDSKPTDDAPVDGKTT